MKKLIPFVIFLFAGLMVMAQQNDAPGQPKEQSNVIREYDESGNLIRFDSTYVRSWSADSLMSSDEFNSVQQQMKELFSGAFGDDSDNFFNDAFGLFDSGVMNQLDDSTGMSMPDFGNSFPDLQEMHRKMAEHFQQFFGGGTTQSPNDSLRDQLQFNFFGSPEEFEKLRKEFQQQFDQLKEPPKQEKPQKNSGSAKN